MKAPQALACLLVAVLAAPAFAGWQGLTTGVTKNLNASYFTSPTLGYAVGADGTALKTTSGGASFVSAVVGTNTLNDAVFLSSQEGYLLGNAGALFKTTNGGTTFTPVAPAALSAADFRRGSINGNAIVFAAYTAPDSYLYYSVNGGATFEAILQAGFEIRGVALTGDATWEWGLSGANYVLLKNGAQVYSGTTPINDLFFYDNYTGYAVGDSGLVLKTTTGGNSPAAWSTLFGGTGAQLNSVYFIAQTIGWIVGDAGTALFTSDGGVTFFPYTNSGLSPSIDLNDIFVVTTIGGGGSLIAHAYAAGSGGSIYKLMAPQVASAEPAARQQGWIGTVEVSGTNFLIGGSGTVAFSGTGLTVYSSTIESATAASAFVITAPDAAVGSRDVTVTNPDQTTGTSTGAFSVLPNPGNIVIRNVWFNGNKYQLPPMDIFNPPTITFEVFSSAATLDAAALHGRILLLSGGVYTKIWDIPASGVTLNGTNDAVVSFTLPEKLASGLATLELYAEDTAGNVSREALYVNVLPDARNMIGNQEQAIGYLEGDTWNPNLGGAKLQVQSKVNLPQGFKLVIFTGPGEVATVINVDSPVRTSATGVAHTTVTFNKDNFLHSKLRNCLAYGRIIDNATNRVIGRTKFAINATN